jgi:hypothetical protein
MAAYKSRNTLKPMWPVEVSGAVPVRAALRYLRQYDSWQRYDPPFMTGIVGRGLFDQHSVDGRVLRRCPQAPRALGLIGNRLPLRVAADALGFPADRFLR